MRNTLILIIILISALTKDTSAQTFHGDWKGKLTLPMARLNLGFSFSDEKTTWKGTLDSPDQKAFGIPLSKVHVNNDSIFVNLDKINLKYQGKLIQDTIQGVFEQNGFKGPLNLTRSHKTELIQQPIPYQTPRPPFNYQVKEVSFTNKHNGINLAGTLTIPTNAIQKKHPALLLIAGSGPMDRDETIFNHKPFAVIADYFTQKGFVVLRYDKRGINQSKGNFAKVTQHDLVEDASYAFQYLRKLPYVDTNKIGIIGHSEGASISFQLAKVEPELDFIVSMAGPAISGKDIILQQKRSLSTSESNYDSKLDEELLNYISTTPNQEITKNKIEQLILKHAQLDKNTLNQYSEAMSNPWIISFIKYDPCSDLNQIKIPLFAINGDKDIQVEATTNLDFFKKCMRNKGLLTTKKYPNLNHLFQMSKSGLPNEYAEIQETLNKNVLDDIYIWIVKKIQ